MLDLGIDVEQKAEVVAGRELAFVGTCTWRGLGGEYALELRTGGKSLWRKQAKMAYSKNA